MALPGCANTEPHGGRSVLTTVPPAVEKGYFILVTGHDLHGLKLPEQTVGRGVDIDTRGEMLPLGGCEGGLARLYSRRSV